MKTLSSLDPSLIPPTSSRHCNLSAKSPALFCPYLHYEHTGVKGRCIRPVRGRWLMHKTVTSCPESVEPSPLPGVKPSLDVLQRGLQTSVFKLSGVKGGTFILPRWDSFFNFSWKQQQRQIKGGGWREVGRDRDKEEKITEEHIKDAGHHNERVACSIRRSTHSLWTLHTIGASLLKLIGRLNNAARPGGVQHPRASLWGNEGCCGFGTSSVSVCPHQS